MKELPPQHMLSFKMLMLLEQEVKVPYNGISSWWHFLTQ